MTRMELKNQREDVYKAGDAMLREANNVLNSGLCTLQGWYDLRCKGYDYIRNEIKRVNTSFDLIQGNQNDT